MKLPDDEARVVLSPGFPSREDFSRARGAHQELRGQPSGVDPFRFLLLPFAFQWRRELLHGLETLGEPVRLTNLVTLQDRFLGFLWRRAGQPVRHSYPEDDIDDAFLARFGVRKEGEAHQVVAHELADELTSFREGMPRWWQMLAEMTTRSSHFIVHVLQESARLSTRLGGRDRRRLPLRSIPGSPTRMTGTEPPFALPSSPVASGTSSREFWIWNS